MSPKQITLRVMIVSVVASAILGIIALLSGSPSHFELRVLGTTGVTAFTSIGALACGALWERQRGSILAGGGTVLCVIAGLASVISIWSPGVNKSGWALITDLYILATATAHLCLLSLARLAPRFLFTRILAYVIIYGLALLLIGVVHEVSKDVPWQAIGVGSILSASITLLTPILHVMSRSALPPRPQAEDMADTHPGARRMLCPSCGHDIFANLGERVCPQCQCRFVIRILKT
jgi:hypothetical protein